MVMMYYPETEESKEPGPTVKVLIPQQNARTVTFDFTHLTWEEFDAVRKFFDIVFAAAESTVKLRDKVAEDAFAAGDDSFSRSYRQVPQFVVRERKEREHSKSVQHGSENVFDPSVSGADSDAGGVRGSGSGMADDESHEDQSEDNGTTPD
jgi:hypothetical protein